MPPNDLALFLNRSLADVDTGGQTSTVGEPSIGNNGNQIFLTGNWYATRSLDHGGSWSFVSPFNLLPPAAGGFCCDQTMIYDPSRDLLFWLLQYIKNADGNVLRVGIKRGATLENTDWQWYDFEPTDVNEEWDKEWFDYNHAALSNNFLYVATNAFSVQGDRWTRSVILRLPLDQLAAGEALSYNFFNSEENFSLRLTQGARSTMHFASHNSNSQIRLFSWPEGETTIAQRDISVATWNGGHYSAPGPDGHNWLSRCDPRITAGWVADGVIGFMWTVNRQGTARPFPFVRVVRIREATKELLDEPDIWFSEYAYAYPDTSPNDRGHVGVALFRGGGDKHPGHVVGIRDDLADSWSLKVSRNGTGGPSDVKWGDYVSCRRHSPDGLTWIATGYTLQGGNSRDEIEPQIVHFGRERDRGAAVRWTTPGP